MTCIYSFTFSLISLLNDNNLQALISISMFAAALGLLKYNKYPAKIMSGDGGSYLIGFYLASSSLNIWEKQGIVNPILLVSLLFIPLIDMIRVILLRYIRGTSPFFPDRTHLHYQLIDNGMSLRNCLLTFFLISIFFSIFNLVIFL